MFLYQKVRKYSQNYRCVTKTKELVEASPTGQILDNVSAKVVKNSSEL